jgi:hypothetical protein
MEICISLHHFDWTIFKGVFAVFWPRIFQFKENILKVKNSYIFSGKSLKLHSYSSIVKLFFQRVIALSDLECLYMPLLHFKWEFPQNFACFLITIFILLQTFFLYWCLVFDIWNKNCFKLTFFFFSFVKV